MKVGLGRRLRVCLSVLRGHGVIYCMRIAPWAGPTPGHGLEEDGWVKVAPRGTSRFHVVESELYSPVIEVTAPPVVSKETPAEVLQHVWVKEEGDGVG